MRLFSSICAILTAHDIESIAVNIQHIKDGKRYPIGERRYRCKDGPLVDREGNANLIVYSSGDAL
jgi:hypothetical protein